MVVEVPVRVRRRDLSRSGLLAWIESVADEQDIPLEDAARAVHLLSIEYGYEAELWKAFGRSVLLRFVQEKEQQDHFAPNIGAYRRAREQWFETPHPPIQAVAPVQAPTASVAESPAVRPPNRPYTPDPRQSYKEPEAVNAPVERMLNEAMRKEFERVLNGRWTVNGRRVRFRKMTRIELRALAKQETAAGRSRMTNGKYFSRVATGLMTDEETVDDRFDIEKLMALYDVTAD